MLYDVVLTTASQPDHIKKEPDGEDSLGAGWFTLEQVRDLSLTPFAEYMISQSTA
ncbi:hypothetical protein [Paenibacillus amylolyticus]